MSGNLPGKVVGAVLLIAAIIAGFRGEPFGALFLGFFSGANFFSCAWCNKEQPS